MKKYIDAELQIVRVSNNDIVTASTVQVNSNPFTGTGTADAPTRRSIWD